MQACGHACVQACASSQKITWRHPSRAPTVGAADGMPLNGVTSCFRQRRSAATSVKSRPGRRSCGFELLLHHQRKSSVANRHAGHCCAHVYTHVCTHVYTHVPTRVHTHVYARVRAHGPWRTPTRRSAATSVKSRAGARSCGFELSLHHQSKSSEQTGADSRCRKTLRGLGHNYICHNYVRHNYRGHNCTGRRWKARRGFGHNYICHNYLVCTP